MVMPMGTVPVGGMGNSWRRSAFLCLGAALASMPQALDGDPAQASQAIWGSGRRPTVTDIAGRNGLCLGCMAP